MSKRWGIAVFVAILLASPFVWRVAFDSFPSEKLLLLYGAVALAALAVLSNWLFDVVRLLDRRLKIVAASMIVAVLVTVAVFAGGVSTDPANFVGATFASWVASVVFFAFVGLVATIVSLARPEKESFDARARILFQRQGGAHIEYIVKRLRETFEQYAEETDNRYTLEDIDQGSGKVLVGAHDTTIIKSYIEDIQSVYNSTIRMWEVTEAPPGKASNRLIYLRVNEKNLRDEGDASGGQFTAKIERSFSTEIPPFGKCVVEHKINTWVNLKSEPFEYTPIRYTKKLKARFENNLHDNIEVKLKIGSPPPSYKEVILRPGEIHTLELTDLVPQVQAYEFFILTNS